MFCKCRKHRRYASWIDVFGKGSSGVIRPCITSIIPKRKWRFGIVLDVGTNADCKPDVLYQFAILGSTFAKEVYKIDNPKVGLLNIGEEPEK